MSLKQHIITVNQFTVKDRSGHGGSRGGTPGQYVLRYMARDSAVEPVAPIKKYDVDDFIVRYMARDEAVESVGLDEGPTLKRRMKRQGQGDGGVAFGYGQVSLSHEALHAGAEDIQRLFDNGHTVMKLVLSFDEDYLRKHKILPEDFEYEQLGDYRGAVDQMKLRSAIMHGLDRMSGFYDDLRYVGVIQVDTENVHCHLALVDAGVGTIMPDGTQRGKIPARYRSQLRRGIDSFLDEHQHVKHLSSAVGYDRQNVTSYVKRWAHEHMVRESLPQFLLATLPEDRRLWRASTNHRAMRKPNALVYEMVEEVLERPDSPMPQVMASIEEYANHRRELEDLSVDDWHELVETGRQQVVDRCVGAVYATLRQLPDDALKIRTPMLDIMGMDYEDMTQQAHDENQDDLVSFSFRLRSYAARKEFHEQERQKYHQRARQWEAADEIGQASVESKPLYWFYQYEAEYHAKCAAKYRHFLPFTDEEDEQWYDDWREIEAYGEQLLSLESMRNDSSLKKMSDPDEAEKLGKEIYGQPGGALVQENTAASNAQLAERVRKMRESYDRRIEDFKASLTEYGYVADITEDETGRDRMTLDTGFEYPFDEVKGLDLHQLTYDFAQDVEIGDTTAQRFVQAADQRRVLAEGAVSYLEQSDQMDAQHDLPLTDIADMARFAEAVRNAGRGQATLPSKVAELAKTQRMRRSATIELTEQVSEAVAQQVRQRLTQFEPTLDHLPSQQPRAPWLAEGRDPQGAPNPDRPVLGDM